MRILNLFDNDFKVAKRSKRRSLQTIQSADWHERMNRRLEYLSEKKLKKLYDGLGLDYPMASTVSKGKLLPSEAKVSVGNDGLGFSVGFGKSASTECSPSLSKLAADATKRLCKANKLVKSYDRCQQGDYVLVRFPLFAGTMTIKGDEYAKYSNAFWWQGHYRDLMLYLSGNVKNLTDDINHEACGEALWDPSGTDASRELFGTISGLYEEGEDVTPQTMALDMDGIA